MSFSGGISTLAVKQVKTVKRADYSIQKFGNKKTGRMCLNRLRTYDGKNLYGVSGEYERLHRTRCSPSNAAAQRGSMRGDVLNCRIVKTLR
jgi:hypothetical protein